MATYPPPTENLPIFDNEVFVTGDEALTYNQAKKKFLRYPTAQGKETLQAVDVNGLANFLNKVGIKNSNPTYDLDVSGQARIQSNKNTVGTQATFFVTDSVSTNDIVFYPNAGAGNYNPIVQNLDSVIFCNNTPNTPNVNTLTITNHSGTTVGIRIKPTEINMGAGAGGGTPSNNIDINGSNNTTTTTGQNLSIQNTNVTLSSTTPPISLAIQPSTSDSSTKIPTTAWVQSVISPLSGPNLIKNSYTVSPTSSILTHTSGVINLYNTGSRIGYVSRVCRYVNPSVGYLTDNPLIINIQNSKNMLPNSSGSPVPSFSPLTNPVIVNINVFLSANDGGPGLTGFIRTKLAILPTACFVTNNTYYLGWGKYNINVSTNPSPTIQQNYAYALDNRINGNTNFIDTDATYCPYKTSSIPTPSPNVSSEPSYTGRQYYSYDTSISSGLTISVLGMTTQGTNINQIFVWFAGFNQSAGANTLFNVTASIEDSSGANITNNGNASGVFLSYYIPPPP